MPLVRLLSNNESCNFILPNFKWIEMYQALNKSIYYLGNQIKSKI